MRTRHVVIATVLLMIGLALPASADGVHGVSSTTASGSQDRSQVLERANDLAAPAASPHTGNSAQTADPFVWYMEPRYDLGWKRYRPSLESDPSDYIYPNGYEVGLDACKSPLAQGGNVTNYRWRIQGATLVSPIEQEITACLFGEDSNPPAPLLAQGDYSVTLTVLPSSSRKLTRIHR